MVAFLAPLLAGIGGMSAGTAIAVGAGATLASAAISSNAQKKANDQSIAASAAAQNLSHEQTRELQILAFDQNMSLANQAHALNKDLLDYSTPDLADIRDRALAAGFNPTTVLGSGYATGQAGNMSGGGMSGGQIAPVVPQLSSQSFIADEPDPGTGVVKPLFVSAPAVDRPIFHKMDIHPGVGWVGGAYIEAYNCIQNYRRKARHDDLPLRNALDASLAQAFWPNPRFQAMVSDYEQAMMDGVVPLQMLDPSVRLRGLLFKSGDTQTTGTFNDAASNEVVTPGYAQRLYADTAAAMPRVWAEMADAGIQVSLSTIDLAKQTASFAKLAEQFKGRTEVAMQLLLQGIRVPDEYLADPILLAKKSTIFGYSERYATDGASLQKSVTTGLTDLTLPIYTPPMNVGGVIMVLVEIVPEQLWERQDDPFLRCQTAADLPNFREDFLDPEKVDVVKAQRIDVSHATPDALFAYEPLNNKWRRQITRIGGKFRRLATTGWFEERGRFWAPEIVNPSFNEDFLLCPEIPHDVFADAEADPFEVLARGGLRIVGNTVFGKGLEENGDYFAMVQEGVDTQTAHQKAEEL